MTEFQYTLVEFGRITGVDEQLVIELVEHGILEPRKDQDHWLFPTEAISRCLQAERMRRDLELDYHSVALALELLERNQRLQQRIDFLERLVAKLRE